jgi:hypothetical protein
MACRTAWWWVDAVDFGKVSDERAQCEQTAHYTLICSMLGHVLLPMAWMLTITEESKIRACYHSNGNVELSAFEAVKLAHVV